MSNSGACLVNIPAPERYAIHKLLVYGERSLTQRAKANKDLGQAASVIQALMDNDQLNLLHQAWQDALGRGPGWRKRALQGKQALLARYPQLNQSRLWGK